MGLIRVSLTIRPFKNSITRCFLIFLSVFLWSFQTSAQVHTVADYAELQIYSGELDSIYVDHERYYGLFVKGDCASTNYGTTFFTNGVCWQRVHNNYLPRYWEMGGRSAVGGKLIEKEVDAINNAAYAAWQAGGDTVEIDRIYSVDRPVVLLKNVTYLGTTDSAGFVRESIPKTVLIDTAHVGDKSLSVQSNEGYRTFQKINIANGQAYDSIAGHVSYTASVSAFFGDDQTIFLSGRSVRKQMLPGDSVGLFFSIMSTGYGVRTDSILLKNLVFDGNREHYNLSYDWRVNTTIQFGTNVGSQIDNCRFYNIPAENIFFCGTTVTNSSGIGFNGSALHFSCNNNNKGTTDVMYNDFTTLNEVGNDVMAHSEAGFTLSSKVRGFRISYNKLNDLSEIGIGIFANDDTANVVTDNLLDTKVAETTFRPFFRYEGSNLIYNNKNPATADLSTGGCLLSDIQPVGTLPCMANSTMDKPLQMGQLMFINLDSLYAINSNENFIKGISPEYTNEFFDLVGISVSTPERSDYHKWSFDEKADFKGLFFDNGHRDGISGAGNWGYELCGSLGGCTNIKVFFRVKKLPAVTSAVPCPLQGLRVIYDGEMNTWDKPVLCDNSPVYFDASTLGMPVLQGGDACEKPENLTSRKISLSTAILNWDTVDESSEYLILYKPVGTEKWIKAIVKNGVSEKQIKRLQGFTEYVWKVSAKCGTTWGQSSEEYRFTTQPLACDELEFSDLSTYPVLSNRARLNWDILPGISYNIRWREVGKTRWKSKNKRPSFRHWLFGLKPETTYEWQIRAVCQGDAGDTNSNWSERQTMTTLAVDSDDMGGNKSLNDLNQAETMDDLSLNDPGFGLKVYPNPARSEVEVSSSSVTIQRLKLVNASGKVMFDKKPTVNRGTRTYKFSLRGLPKGLYFVVVYDANGTHWKRLIIE